MPANTARASTIGLHCNDKLQGDYSTVRRVQFKNVQYSQSFTVSTLDTVQYSTVQHIVAHVWRARRKHGGSVAHQLQYSCQVASCFTARTVWCHSTTLFPSTRACVFVTFVWTAQYSTVQYFLCCAVRTVNPHPPFMRAAQRKHKQHSTVPLPTKCSTAQYTVQ